MWSYYDIEVFIHHACSKAPFDRAHAPAYQPTLHRLIDYGLLERNDEGDLCSTPKGDAWGNMLKLTPVPVQRFIDPRFDPLEE